MNVNILSRLRAFNLDFFATFKLNCSSHETCAFAGQFRRFGHVRHNSQSSTASLESEIEKKIAKAHAKCRYKRLIKAAALDKGPFLEYNPKLAKLVEEAKNHDVSESTIDINIKVTLDTRIQIGMYEMLFPGRGYLVAQYETVDNANVEHKIKEACNPYDSLLIFESQRHEHFNTQGVIAVTGKLDGTCLGVEDKKQLNLQGITSIREDVDLEGKLRMQVACAAPRLLQVKRAVESKGFTIEEAFVGLVPKNPITLFGNTAENLASLLLALSDIPEIDRLYDNSSLSS